MLVHHLFRSCSLVEVGMDFFPNLIHLVVLCISLYLIFLIYKQKSSIRANCPPGKKGWPVIGETLEFIAVGRRGNPEIFIKDRMTKYSQDLFRTSLYRENFVVFCPASGHKFLFSNDKNYLTSWWPPSTRKVALFPEFLESFSHEDFVHMRKFVVGFLRLEALQHFIPIMDTMTKENLELHWSPFKQVKAWQLSKKYSLALACRLSMSIKDPNHVTRFADPFVHLIDGFKALPINIPGTAFNRAIKGGRVIRQELLAIIKQRKKEIAENKGSAAPDLLTQMLLVSDEKGSTVINDMMIAINIMGLLIAGHDTTSAAITFVVKYLAEYPHVYSEVLKGNY